MDMTNRDNNGGGKGSNGRSQDFTNSNNAGGGGGRSSRSNATDLTNAGYGAKAPMSKGFTTVVKNRPLPSPFHGSDPVASTPRPLNIPGFRLRGTGADATGIEP